MRGRFLLIGAVMVFLLSGSNVAASQGYGLTDPSKLEFWEGNYPVRLDGQVVEDLEIHGSLRIAARDVVVRNVWVYTEGPWTIYVEEGSATFENVEIGHPDHVGERGIGGANVTARYLDIHHVEDGVKLGSDSLYEFIHVHDLDSQSADPHADGIQGDGGTSGSIIRDSVIDATGPLGLGNAAVLVKSDLGQIEDVTFERNEFNGGNYTVFVRDGGSGFPSDVSFVDNRFGENFRFGITDIQGGVRWSGNTYGSADEPLELDGTLMTTGSTPDPVDTTSTTVATTTSTVAIGSDTSIVAQSGDAGGQTEDDSGSESAGFSGLQVVLLILLALVAGVGIGLRGRRRDSKPATEERG